jgi:linoleoyl-CoA desaturase
LPHRFLSDLRFASPYRSHFRQELRAAADAYLKRNNEHQFADEPLFLKLFVITGASVACWLCAMHTPDWAAFALWYLGFLVLAMLFAVNGFHDASHMALFRRPWLNRACLRLATLPLGIDPDHWAIRHVVYHHVYPNIQDYDLDMDPNYFLRQSPFQPWYPQYRYQYLYWPLIAALSLPYINWVFDWSDRLGKTRLVADGHLSHWSGWPLFLLFKLGHFGLALAVPIWLAGENGIGWGWVFACYCAGQMIASFFVVALLLGSHWAEREFFRPPANKRLDMDWYELNIRTSCDWLPGISWLGYWMGGLNLHLTHHLFPRISHRHYPALAELIRELAAKHGLPYRRLGYRELIRSQQVFLRAMGQPDSAHHAST